MTRPLPPWHDDADAARRATLDALDRLDALAADDPTGALDALTPDALDAAWRALSDARDALTHALDASTPSTPLTPARAADSFRDGVCVDCGAAFSHPDGAVMRAHRRRVHAEWHATPGACDA